MENGKSFVCNVGSKSNEGNEAKVGNKRKQCRPNPMLFQRLMDTGPVAHFAVSVAHFVEMYSHLVDSVTHFVVSDQQMMPAGK